MPLCSMPGQPVCSVVLCCLKSEFVYIKDFHKINKQKGRKEEKISLQRKFELCLCEKMNVSINGIQASKMHIQISDAANVVTIFQEKGIKIK